jgi:energy-coupling factor transporter ATP-binding protein EcfA2
LRRAVARGDANVVLRNVLYRLSKTGEWEKFLDSFRHIFPDSSISVRFDEAFSEHIEAFVVSGGLEIPLELAGTGMLQMAQILSYVHYFSPRLLILDEPDSHLHPNNQRAMCKLISSLSAEKSMQVIMASHSRHVLDVISRYGRVISASKGVFSIVEDEQELSVLMDLGALDLKERVIADAVEAIVLTEDSDVKPIEGIILSSELKGKKYEILSYGGCSKASAAALLIKFLRSVRPQISIYVHRDRDFMNDDDVKGWSDQIESLHAIPVVTIGVDAESGFLIPAHLAFLNPPLSEENFSDILDASRQQILEEQTKRGINRFIENERAHGRHKFDPGAVAVDIIKKVRDNPDRYMSGKDLLSRVKQNYRDETGQNLNVYRPSEYIDGLSFK